MNIDISKLSITPISRDELNILISSINADSKSKFINSLINDHGYEYILTNGLIGSGKKIHKILLVAKIVGDVLRVYDLSCGCGSDGQSNYTSSKHNLSNFNSDLITCKKCK